mmetsp:Transcript_14392/g.29831  ORF Transcript_14392/g.29831 Transcript_14392/m.29831 type:complete len:100 (-) Transcript_14392:345-644(-)
MCFIKKRVSRRGTRVAWLSGLYRTTSGIGSLHVRTNLGERSVRLGTDRLNSGQTYDDDQSQHHGIFNRGGTVFGYEKVLYLLDETLHENSPTLPKSAQY